MAPGNTLFTVTLNLATSPANVLLQLATAALIVLETPRLGSGCLTDVEMMLMMRQRYALQP